jgi:hypothetical protein
VRESHIEDHHIIESVIVVEQIKALTFKLTVVMCVPVGDWLPKELGDINQRGTSKRMIKEE